MSGTYPGLLGFEGEVRDKWRSGLFTQRREPDTTTGIRYRANLTTVG